MQRLVRFFFYNNSIPLAAMFLMLGAASTFAATNPDTILQKEERVISIDNTYIANVNLNRFSPTIEILSVTEDDEAYYIEYEFTTIALVDHVWQDHTVVETMEVTKESLGGHRDLGVFVTKQLSEKLKAEKKRLVETQKFEKEKISRKKVATKYKGIVGGFLSEEVTEIEGYKPVVKPPKEEQEEQTFARPDPNAKPKPIPKPPVQPPEEQPEQPEVPEDEEPGIPVPPQVAGTTTADGSGSTTDQTSTSTDDTTGGDSGGGGSDPDDDPIPNAKPTVTVLGDNPARVEVGKTYTDLGATVTDDHDDDLSVDVFVDGTQVQKVNLDTSTTSTYTITYRATDSGGRTAEKQRVVEVYAPATSGGGSGGSGSSDTTDGTGDSSNNSSDGTDSGGGSSDSGSGTETNDDTDTAGDGTAEDSNTTGDAAETSGDNSTDTGSDDSSSDSSIGGDGGSTNGDDNDTSSDDSSSGTDSSDDSNSEGSGSDTGPASGGSTTSSDSEQL